VAGVQVKAEGGCWNPERQVWELAQVIEGVVFMVAVMVVNCLN